MQAWLVTVWFAVQAIASACLEAMAMEAANKAMAMDPLFEAANKAMAMEAANNAMVAANNAMEAMAMEAANALNVDADSNSASSSQEKHFLIAKQPATPPPESLQYGGCKQG